MMLKSVDEDGKRVVWTGTEGQVEDMLREALRYGEINRLRIEYVRVNMGHVYDDTDCEVEYA